MKATKKTIFNWFERIEQQFKIQEVKPNSMIIGPYTKKDFIKDLAINKAVLTINNDDFSLPDDFDTRASKFDKIEYIRKKIQEKDNDKNNA